jgi:intergrase/recombinase
MAKNDYSQYQKAVISDYYDNLDTIMLQKLGELVTELYLADTDTKRDRLWQKAHRAMVKLKVPPAIIDHIIEKKDVEILAKNLQDWLATAKKKK